MNEKELDKLLSLDEELNENINTDVHSMDDEREALHSDTMDREIALTKKLKRTMDKQINKKVFRGIFLTIFAAAAFLVCVSFLFDACFYNPMAPSRYHEEVDPDQYMTVSDFHFLMEIYTGLHFTGKNYIQVEELSKKEGFGSYKMYAQIQDVFEPVSINGQGNTVFKMKQNRFFVENLGDENHLTRYIGDFYNDSKADEYGSNDYIKEMLSLNEERMNEIEKLPESAVIYATISFEQSLSMEDVLAFIRKYPESDFQWIAMDSDVQFMKDTYDGISLSSVFSFDLTEEAMEKYPYLRLNFLSEDTTGEQLEQCYLSRLQLMYDNPEFLKVVEQESSFYNSDAMRKMKQLENRFEEIEEEGLWVIGLYGQITKADFISMAEQGEMKYAKIKDAKVSVFSK